MKKIVYVIVMLTSFQFSCNSQQKSNDNQTNNISYTQVFLEKEISTFKIKKYKELVGKISSNNPELDSIILNHSLHLQGSKIYNINYLKDNSPSYVFFLGTVNTLQGLEEYEEYEAVKKYINTLLLFFHIQTDSTLWMIDYVYKPINQGTNSFDGVDLVYNKDNQHLILEQYGGNSFGQWWIEFEFEYDTQLKKWMHILTSLYSAEKNNPKYNRKEMIWKKVPERKPINEVEFPKQVSNMELELLQL